MDGDGKWVCHNSMSKPISITANLPHLTIITEKKCCEIFSCCLKLCEHDPSKIKIIFGAFFKRGLKNKATCPDS